jgi:hypothetical protein
MMAMQHSPRTALPFLATLAAGRESARRSRAMALACRMSGTNPLRVEARKRGK